MTETLAALAQTLDEIELLERELESNPNTDTATRLNASKQVAIALGRKAEREQTEREQEEQAQRLADLQARHSELDEELASLYAEVNAHLTKTLDASEKALDLYGEGARLESAIAKAGGHVPVRERSLWPRYPDLRTRFLNSALRNGQP